VRRVRRAAAVADHEHGRAARSSRVQDTAARSTSSAGSARAHGERRQVRLDWYVTRQHVSLPRSQHTARVGTSQPGARRRGEST